MRVDTLRRIETPEGVDFVLDLAGPVPRSLAALVDMAVRATILLGFTIFVPFLGESGLGFMLIVMFVVEWVYPVYFEMFHRGRTPGKMVLGLQVLHADGTAVTWTGSVVRNVLRFADFLPFFWTAGISAMAVSRDFQRLGDLAADTVVVHRGATTVDAVRTLPEAAARPAPRRLTADEKLAIVRFAQRSSTWNAERSEELAEILGPMVGTESAEEAVERLQGIATSIAGPS